MGVLTSNMALKNFQYEYLLLLFIRYVVLPKLVKEIIGTVNGYVDFEYGI